MGHNRNLELYDLTKKLLDYVEKEYNSNKYEFDDISNKIFLKDILYKLHDIRVSIQKQINKDKTNVKKF
ncbi:hypothetical protein AFAEC_1365 [Aliarcobacter faecis]|uniref:hypothetical protein n=1 Tax=Aliarcobacter faecis TaxID=1564138 RepID=UPI00047B1BC1|nr:hypothetical protein [Aliarcobacter faecis]QKF73526.1 hypothetical protein AFAEC_1365 [Aliarcobacter faecis]